ncbi:MAG: hypothetical protein LIO92_11985 [Clostridiales bacterium]|nr:hypothetical protein [Clostridiales bacterium]
MAVNSSILYPLMRWGSKEERALSHFILQESASCEIKCPSGEMHTRAQGIMSLMRQGAFFFHSSIACYEAEAAVSDFCTGRENRSLTGSLRGGQL